MKPRRPTAPLLPLTDWHNLFDCPFLPKIASQEHKIKLRKTLLQGKSAFEMLMK
jgi:hypothetical protein